MDVVPVRMKDIARDLGISVVTVSKVLRQRSDVSAKTRERVLKRMRELNYRPNLAARALATGKTNLIGLIVPDLVHPFFSELAKGASRVLREKGYGLIISSSEEDPELEKLEIDQMLARNLDACLIASAQWTVESFRRIEELKKPYILVDRKFLGLAANFVGSDDRAIGRMATEHLIANSCRLIAHIGGTDVSPAIERLEGYRQSLHAHGLPTPDPYIICRPHGDDSGDVTGYQAMQALLQMRPRPDAVFCYNDPTAMGAMMAIHEAGLGIPNDIAVVGCGNVHYAGFLRIPLSSIDQESGLMGEHAARLALDLIQSKPRIECPKKILTSPRLIVRDSSRRVGMPKIDTASGIG